MSSAGDTGSGHDPVQELLDELLPLSDRDNDESRETESSPERDEQTPFDATGPGGGSDTGTGIDADVDTDPTQPTVGDPVIQASTADEAAGQPIIDLNQLDANDPSDPTTIAEGADPRVDADPTTIHVPFGAEPAANDSIAPDADPTLVMPVDGLAYDTVPSDTVPSDAPPSDAPPLDAGPPDALPTDTPPPDTPADGSLPPDAADWPVPQAQTGDSNQSGGAQGAGGLKILKTVGVAVLALYALLVAAWGIDLARHQNEVMRGVEFADISLKGMDRAEVAQVVENRNGDLANRPLEISVGDVKVTTDPVAMGLTMDDGAIADQAMAHGRRGFFPFRPFSWVNSFFSTEQLSEQYKVDADATVAAALQTVGSQLEQPREPELEVRGNEMVVIPGEDGVTMDPRSLVALLPQAVEQGEPYRITLEPVAAGPTVSDSAVRDVAAEVNELTTVPLTVQVLDDTATVEPEMLKSWVSTEANAGGLTWGFDNDRILSDLKPLFPSLGSEDQRAKFNVVDAKPIIVPASETVICCDTTSFERIRTALETAPTNPPGDDADDDGDNVELPLAVLEPEIVGADEGVAELESLGIIEQVSTFTTNHVCCQNRVTNIHRIADLTRGVIIRPGETFSLNGFVGRRTRENGFVADGAINLGVLEPQVGGGISQYATTLFNAAFYAGLEFVEYQSHSLYISRYPRGREATISWPKPDLKIKNTTDYGILLWNSYSSTSITVTMYSTKHLEVVDLPLRRSSDRQCRIDITPRLITYPDGTQVEDSVRGAYRPGEGLDCNGESTRPEEEESTPDPDPPSTAPPTTAPPVTDPPADDPPATDPPAVDPPAEE